MDPNKVGILFFNLQKPQPGGFEDDPRPFQRLFFRIRGEHSRKQPGVVVLLRPRGRAGYLFQTVCRRDQYARNRRADDVPGPAQF